MYEHIVYSVPTKEKIIDFVGLLKNVSRMFRATSFLTDGNAFFLAYAARLLKLFHLPYDVVTMM